MNEWCVIKSWGCFICRFSLILFGSFCRLRNIRKRNFIFLEFLYIFKIMLIWLLRSINLFYVIIERYCIVCVFNIDGNYNSILFVYIFIIVLCKLIVLYKLIKNKNGILSIM